MPPTLTGVCSLFQPYPVPQIWTDYCRHQLKRLWRLSLLSTLHTMRRASSNHHPCMKNLCGKNLFTLALTAWSTCYSWWTLLRGINWEAVKPLDHWNTSKCSHSMLKLPMNPTLLNQVLFICFLQPIRRRQIRSRWSNSQSWRSKLLQSSYQRAVQPVALVVPYKNRWSCQLQYSKLQRAIVRIDSPSQAE